MSEIIRLGTRSSALARWQADWVADRLTQAGLRVDLVLITTRGDTEQGPIGGLAAQGVFTKEIQRALLDERVDLAVHSLKDLPTDPVEGLELAVVPPRESPWDLLVSRNAIRFDQLPQGARIGTGSLRRQAQMLHQRPDLHVVGIRGNVETRLRKLDEQQFDAIVLAEAGLRRLGLAARATETLPAAWMLPAVGQGALGLEIRTADTQTRQCLAFLDDPETHASVIAERTLLASLHGGCLAPIAAWGRVADGQLSLDAVVLDPQGTRRIAAQVMGLPDQAEQIGREAARQLELKGAGALIAACRPRKS